MMRRIDLLPARYVARRQERRQIGTAVVAGMLVLLLLFGWWILIRTNISSEQERLETAEAQNRQLQAEIDALQRFADLETEVLAKRAGLQTVFAGDIRWPALLTEIALVVPGEVSLENVDGSAATAAGGAPVGTETAAIRITDQTPQGRIQFSGTSRTMPGVARWLQRLSSVRAFSAVWLGSATAVEEGDAIVEFNFTSTLELGEEALSRRFQDGGQQ